MSRTLYLECASGISGDMTVAALLDLGADEGVLRDALASLPVEGYRVEVSRVKKSGLDACDFAVILDAAHENHDHDMEYLYGHDHDHEHSHDHEHPHNHDHSHDHGHLHDHEHPHDHEHLHDHEHPHDHEHSHDHEHLHDHEHPHDHEHLHDHEHSHDHDHPHDHVHPHEHRGLPEILAIIDGAKLTPRAKELAVRIFTIIGEAEAKAHGLPVNEVHFHEVGAVDSIVDIVAAAVCLDNLGIDEVIVPELAEGSGFVRCQHGRIPVPVPAVLNIAQAHGLTLHMTGVQGELVTPTGAAIAAAVRTRDRLPEHFRCVGTGLGAGKRAYELPGVLRAMLIEETAPEPERDVIWKLESNLDDCTGEALGYAMERLFAAGARDVHYTPVYMKKNRPGWQLNVICTKELIPVMEEIIFTETTTIGIRRMAMERTVLEREMREVTTPYGPVQMKVCTFRGQERWYPEYESVARICREQGISWQEVCRAAQKSGE